MRIFLKIMYDGGGFCGWQIQPAKSSVQGEITLAIKKLTGEDVSLVGSGRTDAGVHALGQAAHFDLHCPFDTLKIAKGLNFYLPPAIRIVKAAQVPDTFNARFSAVAKTYAYLMYVSDTDNPLLNGKALRIPCADFRKMRAAASLFIGTHDFKPFMSSGSDIKTTVRTVTASRIYKKGDFYVYEITANGFLYNMVRKIAAVLLSVGEGKRTAADIKTILEAGRQVKDIAPPYALYLKSVEYGKEFDL